MDRVKTIAWTPDGDQILSGWGSKNSLDDTIVNKVLNTEFNKIKYDFGKSNLDGDIKGRYNASHAEKKLEKIISEKTLKKSIQVSKEMCFDCQDYFKKLSKELKEKKIVVDPLTIRIFYPNGKIKLLSRSVFLNNYNKNYLYLNNNNSMEN